MQTIRVFKLGNAQAVRIPARYRFDVEEVEVFERDGELVLRPKAENAADFFARIRARHGAPDIAPVPRGRAEPVEPMDL